MDKEDSQMPSHQSNLAKMFCLIAGIALFCISCGPKPSPVTVNNCAVVELSGPLPPSCDLSQSADDRIVWKNSSGSPLYACIDSANTPFEAYGWYVPGGGVRSSGQIRKDVTPSNLEIHFWSSPVICALPPPVLPLTSPHIIIHNLQ